MDPYMIRAWQTSLTNVTPLFIVLGYEYKLQTIILI